MLPNINPSNLLAPGEPLGREKVARERAMRARVFPVILASLSLVLQGVDLPPNAHNLKDLGSFLASGQAVLSDRDPYAVYPMSMHAEWGGVQAASPNVNPPILLPLFALLAHFEPLTVAWAWTITSCVLYGLVLLLLIRAHPAESSPRRLVWALALGGFWYTIDTGQLYVWLLAATVGAWLLIERKRTVWAGVLIGFIVAIKPQYAVWPGLLLLTGYWPATLSAGAIAFTLTAIPVLLYGPSIYLDWYHALGQITWMHWPHNVTLAAVAARLGTPTAGVIAGFLLLAALAWWVWRTRPDAHTVSGVALVLAVLSAPFSWFGYTVLILPALWSRPWSRLMATGAAAMAFPSGAIYAFSQLSTLILNVLGGIYPFGLVCILLAMTMSRSTPGERWATVYK